MIVEIPGSHTVSQRVTVLHRGCHTLVGGFSQVLTYRNVNGTYSDCNGRDDRMLLAIKSRFKKGSMNGEKGWKSIESCLEERGLGIDKRRRLHSRNHPRFMP